MRQTLNSRVVTLSLLLVVALMALVACGSPAATDSDSQEAAPTAEPTTIAEETVAPVATDTPAATDQEIAADQEPADQVGEFGDKPVPDPEGGRPLASLEPQQRLDLYQEAPDLAIESDKVYVATIETTKGDIVVELYAREAPLSVNNFVVLSSLGYYDGLPMVPLPEAAVVLAGDPLGTGEGGPGYTVPAELGVPNLEGAVGWLRLPDQVNPERASSGSQFYITLAPAPQLDGNLTVFGQVIDGLQVAGQVETGDVIQEITISEADERRAPTPPPPTPTPPPVAPVLDPAGDRPLADISPAERDGYFNTPPAMQLQSGVDYVARIVTEKGDIVVDLFEEQTPSTVNNFVVLADLGFYDNTTFHRVIEDFMAQAGDPSGTGRGGPGYTFADEFVPELVHDSAGILSMANAGPNTNGSQFFLTFAPTPWLDGLHTVFGKVIEGEDVLGQISLRDPASATAPGDLIEQIVIETR